jgi:hypothetical protein
MGNLTGKNKFFHLFLAKALGKKEILGNKYKFFSSYRVYLFLLLDYFWWPFIFINNIS